MRNLSIVLLLASLSFSGCATIVSGTTQKISVSSTPSGAEAKVDNNMSAKTPTVFTLDRKNDHTIEISKEGYKSVTVLIKRTFNGMATGNILIGGIIGTGIDAASGSMNKLVPERVDIELEEGSGAADKPKFLAVKDQEYYDKNILKADKPAADAAPAAASEAAVAPAVPATTNFGPKTT